MKILSLSTHGVQCGIGDYNSDLKLVFERMGHIYDVEPIDRSVEPIKRNLHFLRSFAGSLHNCDMAVIQHEFSFYGRSHRRSNKNFAGLIRSLRAIDKPICLFMHTILPAPPRRSWWNKWKDPTAVKAVVAAINENPRIRIFVHGAHSKKSYLAQGVRSDQVIDIVFPMSPRREIVPPRNLKNDDFVTLLMFGFISSYKGYETALNAMRLLPENVRLVIAGGRHPSAPGDLTLDAIYGFLETGQWLHKPTIPPLPKRMTRSERDSLRARVELLGHVSHAKLDEVMNSADIVLAPYTPNGPAGSSAIGLALSFGRPIIASAVPVFLDVQQRANCLRLISPYARFELAEAVRQLIGDYPERARMAAAASEFARLNNFGALAQKMIAAHQIDAKPLAAPSAQVLSHT